MQRLRLIAVTLLALGFACAGGKPALATSILIQVDKPTQSMTVSASPLDLDKFWASGLVVEPFETYQDGATPIGVRGMLASTCDPPPPLRRRGLGFI